jgi:hypothetical protein
MTSTEAGRSGMEELALRCEQLARGDPWDGDLRTLNADILRALGWRSAEGDVINPAGDLVYQVPFYAGSLDAAMTLAPDGCWAEGSLSSPSALEIHAPMTFDPLGKGWGATPALALCAASLRARAHLQNQGNPSTGKGVEG